MVYSLLNIRMLNFHVLSIYIAVMHVLAFTHNHGTSTNTTWEDFMMDSIDVEDWVCNEGTPVRGIYSI